MNENVHFFGNNHDLNVMLTGTCSQVVQIELFTMKNVTELSLFVISSVNNSDVFYEIAAVLLI